MLSTRSSSPASPDQRRSPAGTLRHGWPTLIVLPALVMIIGAATLSPLIEMFLGPDFGLSGRRDAPWPWSLAVIGLLGFWAAKILGSRRLSQNVSSTMLIGLGLATMLLWWGIEPVWDVGPVLRDPISLVRGNGHLVLPLFLGLGFWIYGARMGFDPALMSPEQLREIVRNSLIALALFTALAGLIGGDMGGAGISAAILALPVVLVSAAGAIAAAEMDATRRMASQRHTTAPGWDRWARTSGGAALMILLVVGIGALFLGPGALQLVLDGLGAAWNLIATMILWIMYGVIYAIYYIYRFVAWIINSIFGDVLGPMELPEMQGQAGPEEEPMPLQEQTGESEFATLLRWIGLGIALVIVAVIVFMLARRRESASGDGVVEEERSSIFSAELARKQLRDLFRRKPKAGRPHRLDLDRDPGSVRDTMLYLQVLAARQEVGREASETPHDFTERLASAWPDLSGPLQAIRERYERARYGETDEDRRAAIEAWREIWGARKDAVTAPR